MPTLRFILRKNRPGKGGLCPVNLIYDNGTQTYFPTGIKIPPQFWNPDSVFSWVKANYGTAAVSYNLILKDILQDAEDKKNFFWHQHKRWPDRKEMQELMGGKTRKQNSFFPMFSQYIKFKSTERGANNIRQGTQTNYLKLQTRLEKYGEEQGVKFDFEHITIDFYDKFTNFCTVKYRNELNTIGTYIKTLKTYLKWARMRHDTGISDIVMSTLKIVDIKRHKIFINWEEYYKMRDMDLSANPLLDNCRDAAILQITLGCRYGDLIVTLTDNVTFENGNYVFRMITQKTETPIEFILSDTAMRILKKHEGQHPKDWIPSLQKQNYRLKELGKLMGMFEKIPMTKGSGVYRQTHYVPKWKLFSTHTNRRSSVTLMNKSGVPTNEIGGVTGQNIETVNRYKHIDSINLVKYNSLLDAKKEGDNANDQLIPKSPSS